MKTLTISLIYKTWSQLVFKRNFVYTAQPSVGLEEQEILSREVHSTQQPAVYEADDQTDQDILSVVTL